MNIDELIEKLIHERDWWNAVRPRRDPAVVQIEVEGGFQNIGSVYSANGIFIASEGAERAQEEGL